MSFSVPLIDAKRPLVFPPDFKFGVADADLQVIGEEHTIAEEGSEPTMWLRFTEERGISTPASGIDRYHRWAGDLDHMQRLGVQHYRTSVSMARTLTQDGEVNERAIEWYRRYFGALKESGITLYATLYHWELPEYLNKSGGWTRRETVSVLQRHAQVVAERLGDLIDEYFILNEPWCGSLLSYYEGRHAPGNLHSTNRENLRDALFAAHHLLLAQGLSLQAIKERLPQARVSTVLNFEPSYAASASPEDVQAARYRDGYYNTWFLDPTFRGEYPAHMVEFYGEDILPPAYRDDMAAIKVGDKLHALGMNYYRGSMYRAASGDLYSEEVHVDGGPTNSLGWPVFLPPHYPEALYDLLHQVYYGYRAFGLERMYLTENGMALDTPWDGKSEQIDDEPRVHYLQEHLRQVHKALTRGIPIEGYFAWTLMDNFEWAEGYRPESAFGMIHIDGASMTRVWKKSANWYSSLIKTRTL